MNVNVNVLIACWSVVWSCTILAISFLKAFKNTSWIYRAFLWGQYALPDIEFIFLIFIYVFGFWAIGCSLIVLVHWLFTRFSR